MNTLILAEHDNQQLKPATLTAITAATELSAEISLLIAGHQCTQVAEQATKITGITQVLVADNAVYAHGLAENLAALIVTQAQNFNYILAAATAFGKNILPRVAALLDVAQISDVVRIINADTFIRPIYAGNALATVQSQDTIKVLTIRTTTFAPATIGTNTAPITAITTVIENKSSQWLSLKQSAQERPELTAARVVISGGRGLQNAENFKLLNAIADRLNASIGASRAAVDAGFAPNDWQVGQTGKVVAPELYIAIGISGAIQHLAGMKDSKVIVAINKDPDAPIFQVADFGLVGDLFQILPELEKALS
ncbi:MAG TPA: FAD-binding protein [Gammaproteobacteria bacterium]|nr:FAD-binding protein [Gammaproteobacteria bacterium]